MRLISFMLRSARRLFILSIVFSFIGGIATTGLLVTINTVLQRGRSDLRPLSLEFIGLALIALAFRSGATVLLAYLGQNALFDLRMNLCRQIVNTSLRKMEETGVGRILGILTDDVLNITNFIINVPGICTNAAIAITCLVYMGWLSKTLFAGVVIFLTVGVATYEYLTRAANRHISAARGDHTRLLGHLRALMAGIKELKLHSRRREAFLVDVLGRTSADFRRNTISGFKTYAAAMTWGELLLFLAIGTTVFLSSAVVNVSNEVLIAFVVALLYLIGPLDTIINSLPLIGRAEVALQGIEEMQLTLTEQHPAGKEYSRLSRECSCESLELCGVTFSYGGEKDGEKFSLGPLDLSFFPGEIVFITGGNGSGKSTLAKILVGLYKPDTGQIRVNHRPVTEETLDEYRQHFSAVFSDFHLFDSLLGIDHPDLDETASNYLHQLGLDHTVEIKNSIFSTVDLSQGQRKRLALLTAYLEDRSVCLFDEWAADQEPSFKRTFYYQILPDLRTRQKTVFVISHDDRYFHVANRIIKLEYGQVVSDEVVPSGSVSKVTIA